MTMAVTVLQEHVRHCAGGVSSSGLSWLPGPGEQFLLHLEGVRGCLEHVLG